MRGERPKLAPRDVKVVYRDDDLLVVDKPAGVPTTAPGEGPSLVRLVEGLDMRAERLHPTSRLDADVTGLVTFARNVRATKALIAARRGGQYGRCYVGLAVGEGETEREQGSWTWEVAIDPKDARHRVALDEDEEGAGAREACTDWAVAGRAGAVIALHLRPRTGRTHQLRVHAARAGWPLFGDVAYGGAPRLVLGDGRVVTARRVMLHCAWLSLPATRGGKGAPPLVIRAELPADMVAAWEATGGKRAELEVA